MTFRPPKASMREVKRAAQQEVRNRVEVLDHLTGILQRLGGRLEVPAMWYDAIDRNNVDVRLEDGWVVFQVRGWEGRRPTIRQRIALWLLR